MKRKAARLDFKDAVRFEDLARGIEDALKKKDPTVQVIARPDCFPKTIIISAFSGRVELQAYVWEDATCCCAMSCYAKDSNGVAMERTYVNHTLTLNEPLEKIVSDMVKIVDSRLTAAFADDKSLFNELDADLEENLHDDNWTHLEMELKKRIPDSTSHLVHDGKVTELVVSAYGGLVKICFLTSTKATSGSLYVYFNSKMKAAKHVDLRHVKKMSNLAEKIYQETAAIVLRSSQELSELSDRIDSE